MTTRHHHQHRQHGTHRLADEPIKKLEAMIFVCIDVETGGMRYTDPFISVGFAMQNGLGESVMDEKLVAVRHAQSDVKNKTFWDRHSQSYVYMTDPARALEPAAAAEEIDTFLRTLMANYPDIVVVSDNAAFDGGRLNHFLSLHDKPTVEERRTPWKKIVDVHDFAIGRAAKTPTQAVQEVRTLYTPSVRRAYMDVASRNPHKKDHLPHHDAAYTLFLFTSHLRHLDRANTFPHYYGNNNNNSNNANASHANTVENGGVWSAANYADTTKNEGVTTTMVNPSGSLRSMPYTNDTPFQLWPRDHSIPTPDRACGTAPTSSRPRYGYGTGKAVYYALPTKTTAPTVPTMTTG